MYTEFNGRQWSSEESYLEYKLNSRKNLEYSLAIEDYADFNQKLEIYKDTAFQILKEYRTNKDNMTEKELLEISAKIVEKFEELFDRIGREKFTFYDDGDVSYNWPDGK